jgi:protease I
MAHGSLNGVRVAILVTDGFEQVELTEPRMALDEAGAETRLVSPKPDRVKAWKFTEWGDELPVDVPLAQARPEDFDAILLPGGVINPDNLRMDENAIAFAQTFLDGGKPVATICHGPWTLIETGKLKGRRMASWPSLQTDLEAQGVEWLDQEVVVDGNLVSSRMPDDIPAFNREMVALFGRSRAQAAPPVSGRG